MNKIIELDQNLINKIAAGEVVERPASVVKELVENSIDAKSSKIEVNIIDAGTKEITIIDNGFGIEADQIETAFKRHATSKISSLDDLNKILSFGFRGEALSSIASVSNLKISSFNQDSSPITLELESGRVVKKEPKPRTQGTTLSVYELFRHVPARKAFLSSQTTEFRHIQETFIGLAITNPKIHFILRKNNKITYDLKPSSLRERIENIFGEELGKNLIEINFDGPDLKITGFITDPDIVNISAKQYTFINNRNVFEKSLYAAIKEGYRNTLTNEDKPSYFIFLVLDPAKVDVNVHPRKTEVRIIKGQGIFNPLKQTIHRALENHLQNKFRERFDSRTEQRGMRSDEVVQENSQNSRNTIPKNNFNPSDFKFQNSKPTGTQFSNNSRKQNVAQGILFTKSILDNEEPVLEYKYEFVGQIFNTYLLYTKDDRLFIMDQHAGDERVNHEKLEDQLNRDKKILSKPLLSPHIFETEYIDELKEKLEILEKLGVEISHLGDNSFQISAIPEFINNPDFDKLVSDILYDIDADESNLKLNQVQNKFISTIACHSSIRAGDHIEKYQAEKLISDLFKTKLPHSCPHGRPILWEVSKAEIGKNFDRNK